MDILIAYQACYGQRIIENIRQHQPAHWTIQTMTLPRNLPLLVDNPHDFLPANLPQADLLLALCENDGEAQLVPTIAEASHASAVIVPVDNAKWVPEGLKNQLKSEMAKKGITSVFPKTFCTLSETSCCYGQATETYRHEYISEFARFFGKPEIMLKIDKETGLISEASVMRGAPCGSTYRVVEKLTGTHYTTAVPQAGLHAHHYPCLSSMDMQPDGSTLMFIAGSVVNENVTQTINETLS